MTAGKFFVRASADAPEKGPFDRDALRKSFDRGLVKPEAEARPDGGSEWVTLKALFKAEDDAMDRKAEAASYERSTALRDIQERRQRRERGANVTVGVIMLVAGLALTLASLSAGRGGGAIFIGLIVFGIVRIIRGAVAR